MSSWWLTWISVILLTLIYSFNNKNTEVESTMTKKNKLKLHKKNIKQH